MKKVILSIISIIIIGIVWGQKIDKSDAVDVAPRVVVNESDIPRQTSVTKRTVSADANSSQGIRVESITRVKTNDTGQHQEQFFIHPQDMLQLTPIRDISPAVKPHMRHTSVPRVRKKTWAHPKENLYVKGEILVQLKDESREKVNIGTKDGCALFGISALNNLNVRYRVKEISRVLEELPVEAQEFGLDLIYRMQVAEDLDLEAVCEEYRRLDDVDEVSPNYLPFKYTVKKPSGSGAHLVLSRGSIPDDPFYDWSDSIVKGPQCWSIPQTGDTLIRLAVLDIERFDPLRPDMDLNFSGFLGGKNGGGWHGHACASVACAELNNITGISGLAGGWYDTPGVQWAGYNFRDAASNIKGIYWAVDTAEARVITQSIGYAGNPAGLEDAFNYAWENQVISIVAAPDDNSPEPGWPSYYSKVMACGGCDAAGKLWDWGNGVGSNYGEYIDIIGPGDAQFIDTLTGVPGGGNYSNDYAGNSFAAPAVGAAAALMLSADTGLTAVQVRDRLIRSAEYSDHNNPSYAGLMGAGIVNLYEAVKWFTRNVSVNEIFDVPASPLAYSSVFPRALVQNRGVNPMTFDVIAHVDSVGFVIYADTVQVTDLPSNNEYEQHAQIVEFKRWMPVGGSYTLTIHTTLAEDKNRENDTISMTVTIPPPHTDTLRVDSDTLGGYGANGEAGDREAVQIHIPEPCTVYAILYYPAYVDTLINWRLWDDSPEGGSPGDLLQSGAVRPNVEGAWYRVNVTPFYCAGGDLFPGWEDVATPYYFNGYDDSLADPPFNWWYNGSTWALDDYFRGDFFVRLVVRLPGSHDTDAAASSIIEPPLHVIPGYPYQPQGVVSNIGKTIATFPVYLTIDSLDVQIYSDSITVSNLLQGTDDTLTFQSWNPNWSGGTYDAALFTNLISDQDPTNDTIFADFFCSDTDTLYYDSGVFHHIAGDSLYLAVRYCLSDCQFQDSLDIVGILYHLSLRKDVSAPEYVPDTLFIWEADSGDVPGTELHQGIHTPSGSGFDWHYYVVSPPVSHHARDFWVGVWQPGFVGAVGTDTTAQYVTVDADADVLRSRLSSDKTDWLTVPGDNMIRAVVVHRGTKMDHDVMTKEITEPSMIVSTLYEYATKARVKNIGSNTESFDAVATITESGGSQVYQQTVAVSNIVPGEIRDVTFPDPKWLPVKAYQYYDVSVYTTLGTDENSSNDTLIQDSIFSTPNELIFYDNGIAAYHWSDTDYVYTAQRFTSEQGRYLCGCWVAMYSDSNPWSQCSLFIWKDDDGWYDGGLPDTSQLLFADTITFAPGDTGAYWFFISFPRPWIEIDSTSDFFIGLWNPEPPHILLDYGSTVWRSFCTQDYRDSVWNTIPDDLLLRAALRSEYGVAPKPPSIYAQKNASKDSVVLYWETVTQDTLDDPAVVEWYDIYSDTDPAFIPGDDYWLDNPSDTFFIEALAPLYPDTNRNYLNRAFSVYLKASEKSNMAYVFHKFLNENAGATSDRNWVSLPYMSEYDSIKDLTNDLSPSGNPISKITRLDAETQAYFSWIYHPILNWYGNHPTMPNFPIVMGQAYEMVVAADDTVIFVGSNDPDGVVSLNQNVGITSDRNWVSIPYNAVYDSVMDITDELSPSGVPVSKITFLDEEIQAYFSWIYHPILGWYGNHPTTQNFPIERGDGYEFIATKDTTWNPTEYSNEAVSLLQVRRQGRRLDIEFKRGTSLEPDRFPAWTVAEKKSRLDYADALSYRPVVKLSEKDGGGREPGISHTVYCDCVLDGYENMVFTAYRLHRPYDVLTEQSVGSVIAWQDGVYRLISFDVGNFRQPWFGGEEVVLIIEATKDGRGYFTVVDFELDQGVDIQQVSDDITLIPIPEPVVRGSKARLSRVENENVVGYSIYRGEERLNERILTEKDYFAKADLVVKPVIKGGYETVYSAHHGPQSTPGTHIPISYVFDVKPNPFMSQTRVDYALPKPTSVEIVIYDAGGRMVSTLVSEMKNPGYYSEIWNGVDEKGRHVASGVYFVRFSAAEFQAHDKILLIR